MHLHIQSPAQVAAPASRFAQGVTVSDASRWLLISGQVGRNPDGTLAGDTRAQMECSFRNLFAVLADADMGVTNLVKLTVFLTSASDVALYREVRDTMLGGHLCASTLLVVSALASPDWTVEIEALAAA